MIENVILSAFADEYSPDIDVQLEMLSKNGVKFSEPRFIGGKNVADLSESETKELKGKLDFYGIGVSSIGSPIGKIKLSDSFSEHKDKARQVFENANILGTKNVRVFSFYLRDGATRAECRSEVIEKLDELITLAEPFSVTLCHENEAKIYGESPAHCFDILSHFEGRLRQVYDMGNFTLGGYEPYPDAFRLLCPYIEYFHIKDSLSEGAIVPPGKGKAFISEILKEYSRLSAAPFFATLEPHLETFSGLNKLTESTFNNPFKFESPEKAFLSALSDIKNIISEV